MIKNIIISVVTEKNKGNWSYTDHSIFGLHHDFISICIFDLHLNVGFFLIWNPNTFLPCTQKYVLLLKLTVR